MRRRSRGERTPLNAEINVVSLIDVMMLLMVIFMITAPIMQGGVDVSLPKTASAPLESKGGMTISITSDGRIFADETRMSLATFRATFPALSRKAGKDGVYIRGDEKAGFGIVAQVLAIVRAAGVTNVGIVTVSEEVQR